MKLTSLGSSSDFFSLLANLGPDKELLVSMYAGDKFVGIWPRPTTRLGTGVDAYTLLQSHQFDLTGHYSELQGSCG